MRVVIAERGLKDGKLEVQGRSDAQPSIVPLAEVRAFLSRRLAA
jgi:hypothetical protein